jgi:hypothetical protein
METHKGRKGSIPRGLSKAKLEEHHAQLLTKESQLREQSEMLIQQKEKFLR